MKENYRKEQKIVSENNYTRDLKCVPNSFCCIQEFIKGGGQHIFLMQIL